MKHETLPEALAWAGEHASEMAIVAIADAQVHLVPLAVMAHCETCAECNESIAAAALLSLHTGEALSTVPRADLAPASSRARVPFPWRALAAAACAAVLGATPALYDASRSVPSATASFVHGMPIVVKGFGHLLNESSWPIWATLGPAALLMVMGFALTRALPALASHGVRS